LKLSRLRSLRSKTTIFVVQGRNWALSDSSGPNWLFCQDFYTNLKDFPSTVLTGLCQSFVLTYRRSFLFPQNSNQNCRILVAGHARLILFWSNLFN
jgi:hypothetical protein